MQEKKRQNQGLDNIDFYVSPKTRKGSNSKIHPSANTRDGEGVSGDMADYESRNPFYPNADMNHRLSMMALGA